MSTNVHYCIVLTQQQQDELSDKRSSINRNKCLNTLLHRAQMTEQTYQSKGFRVILQVGQVVASEVELASLWNCERKSASRIIDLFNRMGLVSTVSNNRTSIHTILCLSGWIVNGEVIRNPNYIRPSANITDCNSNDSAANIADTSANTDKQHIPTVASEIRRMEDSQQNDADVYGDEYFSFRCMDDMPVLEDDDPFPPNTSNKEYGVEDSEIPLRNGVEKANPSLMNNYTPEQENVAQTSGIASQRPFKPNDATNDTVSNADEER